MIFSAIISAMLAISAIAPMQYKDAILPIEQKVPKPFVLNLKNVPPKR